jgi:uncharacterized protein YcaQ
VGISDAGAWRYAFIYDLTHRHYPHLIEQAREIKTSQARQHLASLYFQSVGLAQMSDLIKLFQWRSKDTKRTVDQLVETGFLLDNLILENEKGEWIGLREIA